MKRNLVNKLIAYILLITMLILLIPSKVAAATTSTSNVEIAFSKTSVKAGETFDVSIYVKGCKINAFIGNLVYTKTNYQTLLKSNIQISTTLTNSTTYGNWGIASFNESTGVVYFEEDQYNFYQFSDSTLMAKITFTALKDVTNTSEIHFEKVFLTAVDQNNQPLDIYIPSVSKEDALYVKSKSYVISGINFTTSYDIGTNKEYEDGDLYLTNVQEKTTVTDFIKNLDTNGTVTVQTEAGAAVDVTKYIGSGMKVIITGTNKTVTLTAIVVGDLDGDGKSSITDLSRMNQAINQSITLKDSFKKAADVDHSGTFTISDLSRLNQYLNGSISKLVK